MNHITRRILFIISILAVQLFGPSAVATGATGATGAIEMADSMELVSGRKSGQSLSGQKMQTGSAAWIVDGSIVLGDDGATSAKAAGGTAFHQIPPAVGVHRIAAEICPASLDSCAGIALFKANPTGNFFGASEVSVLYTRGGGYAINIKGLGAIKQGSKADYPDFKADGFNKLELSYDSVANILSVKINGGSILENFPIKGASRPSLFPFAGVRLNGILTPGAPKMRNYAASVTPLVSAGLVPANLADLFFEPRSDAALRFKVDSIVPGQAIPFVVSDYAGAEVLKGKAEIDAAGEILVKVNLARGYYDLRFPSSSESFGLVALERADQTDPFFCMDSSLSWLETNPERRVAMVKILARSGIAMSRERLGLGGINPVKGKFNWV